MRLANVKYKLCRVVTGIPECHARARQNRNLQMAFFQREEAADPGDANTADPPDHKQPEEDSYGYANPTLFKFGRCQGDVKNSEFRIEVAQ